MDLPTVEARQYLLVEARVDGAGPFRLLVDTGASGLVLSTDAAEAARIPIPSGIDGAGFQGRVGALEAGRWRREGLPARIVPPAELARLRRLVGRCDGFLGLGVFQGSVLEIDVPGRQVSLVRPEAARYPASAAVPYAGGGIRVPIEVCGRAETALVDTGSNFFLILPHFASYPVRGADRLAPGVRPGAVVPDFARAGRLDGTARLGPVTWRDPPVREQAWGGEANLGIPAFAGWKLAIDQAARRIYFLPGTPPPADLPADGM